MIKNILKLILKSNFEISWGKEIIISLKDWFSSIYWLRYDQIETETKNCEKLRDWFYDPKKYNDKLENEYWNRTAKNIKNNEIISITKDEDCLHFVQYIRKQLIVRNDSEVSSGIETPKEDLLKITSATEMYLCTWDKKILRHYVESMLKSEVKIKEIFAKSIKEIDDYVLFIIFLNILPESTISTANSLVSDHNKKTIRNGEATIFLNQNFGVVTKTKIKFRSMIVEYNNTNGTKYKGMNAIFEFANILDVKCAQLWNEKPKNVKQIQEFLNWADKGNYTSVSIGVHIKYIMYEKPESSIKEKLESNIKEKLELSIKERTALYESLSKAIKSKLLSKYEEKKEVMTESNTEIRSEMNSIQDSNNSKTDKERQKTIGICQWWVWANSYKK